MRSIAGPRSRPTHGCGGSTHGKHLFLRWDNGLTIHSHLRMSGRWRIFERDFDQGRLSRGSWLVIEAARHSIVQFQGPILELIREPG